MISVGEVWELIGTTPSGSEIRMVHVFNETRIIGRLLDLGDGSFRAEYISVSGEFQEEILPDYIAALQVITIEAIARHRILN